MRLVAVTKSLLSAFDTVAKKTDRGLDFYEPVVLLDGNYVTVVTNHSVVGKHNSFQVDLLWNEVARPMIESSKLPEDFEAFAATGARMRANDQDTTPARLIALMLRATRKASIDGKQITQSLQALGFDVNGWKITRNYITDGLLFDVRQVTTGDGQDKKETYTPATFEDFVTDLSSKS